MEQLVDSASREWIEARSSWIVSSFGLDQIQRCPVALSANQFLPDDFVPGEQGAQEVLERLCRHAGIESQSVELSLLDPNDPRFDGSGPLRLHAEMNGKHLVWINEAELECPELFVTSVAHAVARIRLLQNPAVATEDDLEVLAELSTVFLGFGVFAANHCCFDKQYTLGEWYWSSIQRRSQLTMPMYGFALAWFGVIRDEPIPNWLTALRLDVRNAFKKSAPWLQQFDRAQLLADRECTTRPTILNFDSGQEDFARMVDEDDEPEMATCKFCETILGPGKLFDLDVELICPACLASIHEQDASIEQDQDYQKKSTRLWKPVGLTAISIFLLYMIFNAIRDLIAGAR